MEQRKLSASSVLFGLLFYTLGVWAYENESPYAGDFFIIMAVMFGGSAVLSVVASKTIALVVSTMIMLVVGVYLITPIATEAIQEMMNLMVAALLEAIETSDWVIPIPELP